MEQSFLKSNNSPARQEIHSILWKPNVHYQNYKTPPLVPIQSHTNHVHTLPTDFVDTLSYYTPPHVRSFKWSFSQRPPSTTTLYAPLLSPVYATRSTHKCRAVWNQYLHLVVYVAVLSTISVVTSSSFRVL
jgi:hypothetical protein